MNRIEKFLAKLNSEDFGIAKDLLHNIENSTFINIHIKKLGGYHDLYRAKHGRIRAIFRIRPDRSTETLRLEFKDDNTYKNL